MKRSAPMNRGRGFKRPERERVPQPVYKLARPCSAAVISTTATPVLKLNPVRSEPYRRLVAALPCIRCGIEQLSQHAHGNYGKGMALKTCDLYSFPLCADQPGRVGCHTGHDQGALLPREIRREVEAEWARRTLLGIVAEGKLPAGLSVPVWAEAS
ncbi:MAG TPA: hypothetical protein VGF12_00985 [Roseateles sp.]|uniref:hypothetical protein n=1 Tax=Roseateles sp. TaxID=1971397 RepID=UPI002ED787D6